VLGADETDLPQVPTAYVRADFVPGTALLALSKRRKILIDLNLLSLVVVYLGFRELATPFNYASSKSVQFWSRRVYGDVTTGATINTLPYYYSLL
jgi:hypothetical protein